MLRFKLVIALLLVFGIFLIAPAHSSAFSIFGNGNDQVCNSDNSSSPVCQAPDKGNPVINAIRIATNIVALLAGVLAVFMIILSGFTMITSAGKEEAVANSRKRITSAVIGLIIVALSWTLVRFITDNVIQ